MYYESMSSRYYPQIVKPPIPNGSMRTVVGQPIRGPLVIRDSALPERCITVNSLGGLGQEPSSMENAQRMLAGGALYIETKLKAFQEWVTGAAATVEGMKKSGYSREAYDKFVFNIAGAAGDLMAARERALELKRAKLIDDEKIQVLLDDMIKLDQNVGKLNVEGERLRSRADATIFGVSLDTYYSIILGIVFGPIPALLSDVFGVTKWMAEVALDTGHVAWKTSEAVSRFAKEWAPSVVGGAGKLLSALPWIAAIVLGVTLLPAVTTVFKRNPSHRRRRRSSGFPLPLLIGGGAVAYWLATKEDKGGVIATPRVSTGPITTPRVSEVIYANVGELSSSAAVAAAEQQLRSAGIPYRIERVGNVNKITVPETDMIQVTRARQIVSRIWATMDQVTA